MKLTKLRIKNFKSFSRQVDLPITTGLTGIVGPNGCGKSNLTEAVRWVMGETSAKRLRGKGMSDVIFSGSKQFPAAKICEVEVVFDPHSPQKSEQWENVDECVIKRTCEIEKGSSYSINGKPCRARDIQLFFADLGCGASSHAFVAQGHVTKLISQTPEERRHLLSEASGAKGLEVRRKDILQKLSTAESNLTRLKDILGIDKNHYETLSFQAKKAEKYRDLSSKISIYNNVILWSSWKKSLLTFTSTNIKTTKLNESLELLQNKLIQNDKNTLNKKQLKLNKSEQYDIYNHKIKVTEVNIASIKTRSETYEIRKNDIESQISIIEDDIQDSNQRLGEIKVWIEDHKNKEIQSLNKNTSNNIDPIKLKSQKIEFENTLIELKHKRKIFQNLIKDIFAKNNQSELQKEKLKNKIYYSNLDYNKYNDEISKLSDNYNDLDLKIKNRQQLKSQYSDNFNILNNEKEVINSKVILLRNEWNKSKEILAKAIQEYNEEKLELITKSKSIKAEIDGLSKFLKHIVASKKPNGLINEIEMPNHLVEAVVMALGDDIQAEITATGDYFWIVNDNKLNHSGIFKSSLWDKIKGPDCIKARMQRTLLVEDLLEGRQKQKTLEAGQCIVSKDGWLFTWDGIICHVLRQSRRAQAVATESKISSLKLSFSDSENLIADLKNKFNSIYNSLNETVAINNDNYIKINNVLSRVNNKILQLNDSKIKYFDETGNLNFQLNHCQEILSQKRNSKKEIISKIENLNNQLKELDFNSNNINENKIIEIERQIKQKEESEDELLSKIRKITLILQNHDELKLRFQQQYKDWQQRNTWLTKELSRQNNISLDLEQRLSAHFINLEMVTSSLSNKSNINELQANLQKLKQEFTYVHTEIKALEKFIDEVSSENSKLQSEIRSIAEERATCEEKNRLGKIHSDELISRLEQGLDIPVDDFISFNKELTELPMSKLKQNIQSFEVNLNNIGSVNLIAAKEAEELLNLIDEKKLQEEDLGLAIIKLQKGIDEIDKDAHDKIYATLEELKKEFTYLYTRLFGGGTARLELLESESLWTSGLEIFAAPPGKKIRTLSLLSGGEQTLTALSLLLAVHRLSKVPFCILDEVDAPLDDHNVEKFVKVLEDMFPKENNGCCFVVTHNRFTMSNVDKLLGVTMTAPGLSQVVSVDLHQAVNYTLVE